MLRSLKRLKFPLVCHGTSIPCRIISLKTGSRVKHCGRFLFGIQNVTGQQLRPILDFPNLERLMIVSDSSIGDSRASSPLNLLSELREKYDIYPSDQK